MEGVTPSASGRRLRPLAIGEILEAAVKLYLAHARTLMQVVLVLVVPLQLIALLITSLTTESVDAGAGLFTAADEGDGVEYGNEALYVGGQIAIIALGILVVLFATAACFRAVADAYLGRRAEAATSLKFAARRAGPVLWLSVLSVVLLAAAFLALIVPAIWLGIAWAVALPVLLFEGHEGTAALRRSFRLVEGRWWATAGALVAGFLVAGLTAALVQAAVVGAVLAAVDSTSFAALALVSAASVIAQVITTPFEAALLTVVYFDLRVRKEAFTLDALADRIGVEAVPAVAPRFLPPVPPEPSRPLHDP